MNFISTHSNLLKPFSLADFLMIEDSKQIAKKGSAHRLFCSAA